MTNIKNNQIQNSIVEIKVSQALNELGIEVEQDKKKLNTISY